MRASSLSIAFRATGCKARAAKTTPTTLLLAEFGLVFALRPAVLRQALPDVIEDASNEIGAWDAWRVSVRLSRLDRMLGV